MVANPPKALLSRLKLIKCLIMDVDGVLTDDKLFIGPDGFELKRFDVGDGLATWFARRIGLELAIISSRFSAATVTRAQELHVKYLYQEHDKLVSYEDLKSRTGFQDRQIAFIGNDLLDLPLAKKVGVAICTANSIPILKKNCHYVTRKRGGEGAVRELIEIIMKARGIRPEDMLK